MAGEAQKGPLARLDAEEKARQERAQKLFQQSVEAGTGGAITGLPEEERPAAMQNLMNEVRDIQAARERAQVLTERNQPKAKRPPPKKGITMHDAVSDEGNQ